MASAQDLVELHPLQPNAAAHDNSVGPAAHTAVSAPGANAASPPANGHPQSTVAPPPKPARYRCPLTLWKKYSEWWLELAGALASIILLIAIVVFLFEIDGSRLDDWHLAWQIKPPTIVSILVTLCRITLAFFIAEGIGQLKWVFFEQRPHQLSDFNEFDEATRGPWGATTFIWRLNRRAFVASFGALMAILVLAMDPFSQQVLFYASQTTNVTDAIATTGAANLYDSGALRSSLALVDPTHSTPTTFGGGGGGGPATFGGNPPVMRRDENDANSSFVESQCSDTLMARAAYGGLFDSENQSRFSCPSGNCTWPAFSTLGICSTCTDITSMTEMICANRGGIPGAIEASYCKFQLPGYTNRSDPYSININGPIDYAWTPFKAECGGNGFYDGLIWLTAVRNRFFTNTTLMNFVSFRYPKDYIKFRDCKMPKPVIQNCTLSWCAKTFTSVTARNGQLDESAVQNVDLVPFDSASTTCTGLAILDPPRREANITWQGFVNSSNACPKTSGQIGPNDVYWINSFDHAMTVNLLNSTVANRNMSLNAAGGTYIGSASISQAEAAIMTAMWDNHGGNLSRTLADISTAMTNRIRQADGSHQVYGITTSTTTIVRVNWYWLIYMVAMVVLSLAFFVTAVVFASEKSKVVWKSSSLAMLMHGLDGFEKADLDHRTIDDMEKAAENLWTQLETNDEGSFRLVRH